ncbi:hypothetical protein Dimus_032845 [Dionaea muscipula]
MEKDKESQLNVRSATGQDVNEGMSTETELTNHPSTEGKIRDLRWWIQIVIYTILVLGGQSSGTLLGRLYFAKGGKSIWLSTVLQLIGFPMLIPFYYVLPSIKDQANDDYRANRPSAIKLAMVFLTLGLLIAAECVLYSIGLQNLPVSTYSLICASQLAFNAIFAFFLNAQKFTPYILNSLVLLTISSALLVFQNDSSNSKDESKQKYAIGFICTVGASAGFSLVLSLTQFTFQRVLKTRSFIAILDMIIYPSLIASLATIVGLFASGQWRTIGMEMEAFKLGKVSYIMTLIWIAISWMVFSIGATGLIVQISSLFSNVISTLGLPLIPVLAVMFFHEKMDGIKAVAMLLAIWGFVSYTYQHYLDAKKEKVGNHHYHMGSAPKASNNHA